MLAQQLGALDAGGDVGRHRVGEVQVLHRERLLPGAAVEVEDAERLAWRAQQDAEDRGHRPLGDAPGVRQFGVFIDAVAEDRLAATEAAISQALAELEASAGLGSACGGGTRLGAARGDRLDFEFVVDGIVQDDGAALGVEDRDTVVEDRLEEVLFLFDVDEMVPGAQQRTQLLAGTRAMLAVDRQPFDRLVPTRLGGPRDAHQIRQRLAADVRVGVVVA